MNKIIALVSGLALILQAMSTMAAPPQPAKTKTFAQWCQQRNSVPAATKLTIDRLLKKAGTKNCELADSKLNSLTELDLSGGGISDLKPLSGLTKLTGLYLSDNKISDLKPLSGLTNLTYLGLYKNKISDLQPLSGLTKLTQLELDLNKISNVKPLAGLSQLKVLSLQDNQISDPKPLYNLSKLSSVCLFNNKIVNKNMPFRNQDVVQESRRCL
jgi:internalin A